MFFSNPESDQDRLQRAGAAVIARSRAYTIVQFQNEKGLTGAEAKETSKDYARALDVVRFLHARELPPNHHTGAGRFKPLLGALAGFNSKYHGCRTQRLGKQDVRSLRLLECLLDTAC